MKRIHGGKELLLKAKLEAKRQEKRRVKRSLRGCLRGRQRSWLECPGAPPVLSPEIPTLESSNQK